MYVPLFVLVALSTEISYTVITGHRHVRVITKGMIVMSDSFTCPYCNSVMPLTSDTLSSRFPSFCSDNETYYSDNIHESSLHINFHKCPKCNNYSISANGIGAKTSNINCMIQPKSLAKQFPEYVPKAVRNDYEEACAIVNLSPKASATLSRRCLQGIIRDFFQISKKNLYDEIDAIKPNIPAEQWAVLDGLRRIGNIGAHMEKDINLIIDIEPDEAQKLIKLIELLIQQWYIERHNQQQLYADIIGIDNSKQNLRKKIE